MAAGTLRELKGVVTGFVIGQVPESDTICRCNVRVMGYVCMVSTYIIQFYIQCSLYNKEIAARAETRVKAPVRGVSFVPEFTTTNPDRSCVLMVAVDVHVNDDL